MSSQQRNRVRSSSSCLCSAIRQDWTHPSWQANTGSQVATWWRLSNIPTTFLERKRKQQQILAPVVMQRSWESCVFSDKDFRRRCEKSVKCVCVCACVHRIKGLLFTCWGGLVCQQIKKTEIKGEKKINGEEVGVTRCKGVYYSPTVTPPPTHTHRFFFVFPLWDPCVVAVAHHFLQYWCARYANTTWEVGLT